MNTPNYGYDWQTGAGRIDRTLFDEGLRQHMLRVYNYMGLGLVSTGCLEDNTFLCAEIGHGPFRSRGHSGKRRPRFPDCLVARVAQQSSHRPARNLSRRSDHALAPLGRPR